MLVPLVKYNISYYIKSVKYLPPVILFATVISIVYQTAPIGIWSNLHVTTIVMFIFASWIASSLINSEVPTQQYITILHVKNETLYHMSKIVSIIVFLIPFYIITLIIPLILGSFTRRLLISEVIVYIVVYFLIGLLGASIGIFFNSFVFSGEMAILIHLTVISIIVVPFNVIFEDNLLVVYASYLLPPINFMANRLHNLSEGIFVMDFNFFVFVIWVLGYSLVLITLYNIVIQKRNKS